MTNEYSYFDNYLKSLEEESSRSELDKYYLWPRTPINDIQSKIRTRVGATDYQIELPYSRPSMILKQIDSLVEHGFVMPAFTLLDIACGDGIILWQIRRRYPNALLYGVDCNKGRFDSHEMLKHEGIRLFSIYIQNLFVRHVDRPFDIVLMLNTYRGWEHADLREHERNLPSLADAWFERNARYVIMTATRPQIRNFKKRNYKVHYMGKGEDNSKMICLSTLDLPQSKGIRGLSVRLINAFRKKKERPNAG